MKQRLLTKSVNTRCG